MILERGLFLLFSDRTNLMLGAMIYLCLVYN